MVERKNKGKDGGVEGEKEEKKEGRKGKLDRLKHSEGTRENSVWRTEFIIFSLYVHRCTVITFDRLFSYDMFSSTTILFVRSIILVLTRGCRAVKEKLRR